MFVIPFLLLMAPGLIAIRILWSKKEIKREDYKTIVCDYIIYSFLIHMAVYALMFITYPERSVSFATETVAISHILSASFVFKYAAASLAAAVILPALVSRLAKLSMSSEDKDI
jgi:hypothetical protein